MALLGWQRKLSLLSVSLFLMSWAVYSVGFCWRLARWRQDLNSTGSNVIIVSTAQSDPLNFPYFVVLVVGPFVFCLGLLHTVLPSIASSIVGLAAALVSTLFSVSNGWVVYSGALYLKLFSDSNVDIDLKDFLMFCGALAAAINWCVVTMFSISYDYSRRPNTYGLSNYNEIFSDTRERSQVRKIPFTPGLARIFSVPFIILSAVGWCVFVAGADKLPNLSLLNPAYPTSQSLFDLSFYGSMVVGPLLFLAALLHAGCLRGASTVMGVFTAILQTVYVVFMGFITTELGRYVYFSCQKSPSLSLDCSLHRRNSPTLNVNVIYTLAGGVGSLFFWSIVVALWPFFRKHPSPSSDSDGYSVDTDAVSPMTYGTMQLKESVSYSNRSTQRPRQSLIIAESNEHK